MLNFFDQQALARRNARLLVWLLVAAVVTLAAVFHVLATPLYEVLFLSKCGEPLLGPVQTYILSFGGTATLVALAIAWKSLALASGGSAVANALGARRVILSTTDLLERRLLNVVEEMAIAASIPVPQVYLLHDEQGINAFAAGYTFDDAIIAVTRGALEKLSRDELEGVIAHELSHILNGDMRLNLRLVAVTFGLMCLTLIGRLIARIASTRVGDGADAVLQGGQRERGGSWFPLWCLGGLLIIFGALGEFLGNVIRAAVSRQREYLADASAVQFTRNPRGIAGALKKILGWPTGATLSHLGADEYSHFFIEEPVVSFFSGNLLASHPPLHKRIARLDPQWSGEVEPLGAGVTESPSESEWLGFAERRAINAPSAATPSASLALNDHVGKLLGSNLVAAQVWRRDLDPVLREALKHPVSCLALVAAVVAPDGGQYSAAVEEAVASEFGAVTARDTLRLREKVATLSLSDRFVLVQGALPELRAMSTQQRLALSRLLERLIDIDGHLSAFECMLAHTLQHRVIRLARDLTRDRYTATSPRHIAAELDVILAVAAARDAEAFNAARAALGLPRPTVPPAAPWEPLLRGLPAALDCTRRASPALRAQLIDAIGRAVWRDGVCTDAELMLVRAICDALDCPLPAFAPPRNVL